MFLFLSVLRFVLIILLCLAVSAHAHKQRPSVGASITKAPVQQSIEPIVIRVTGYAAFSTPNLIDNDEKDKTSDSKNASAKGTKTKEADSDASINYKTSRLMAIRASKLDAYRALAERIYGIGISGSSTVKDFALQSDSFAAVVDSYVRGARVVSILENKNTGMETVLEVLLPGDFQDCLNKVNSFKYGLECLQPFNNASSLNASGSAMGESSSRQSSQSMQSVYFLN